MTRRLALLAWAVLAACSTVSQLGEIAGDVAPAMDARAREDLQLPPDSTLVSLEDSDAVKPFDAIALHDAANLSDAATSGGTPIVFPGVLAGLQGNKVVAAGNGPSCGIGEGYTLYCWGNNARGQLGAGDAIAHSGPVDTGLRGVVDVAVGEQNVCAVLSSGDAYCWGDTRQGQLGQVSSDPIAHPMQIALIGLAATVSIGGASSKTAISFLMRDGTVFGLGDNTEYLVRGKRGPTSLVPVQTQTNATSFSQASAGARRTCGIWQGRVMCWGSSYVGSSFPFGLSDEGFLDQNMRVSVGYDHACVLGTSGRVRCVGNNASGQLGVPSLAQNERFPADPLALTAIMDVAVGRSRSCVVAGSPGRVHCFGAAGASLSSGSGSDVKSPRVVTELPEGALQVSVGVGHICALVQNTGIYCWGDNANGELGRATSGSSGVPLQVLR